ncbi:MAG: two-component system, sensor histidine kinase YesM [Clostridiales bacterium]|nr:two-component system, sensor histidine kinase YesM [Clostridiales bacterium]
MKGLLKRFNDWKLGYRILFVFIFGGIVPLLLLQEISFSLNSHYMTKNVDEVIKNNLEQMSERTDLTLRVYSNLLYQIYTDEDIIANINELQDDLVQEKVIAYNRIFDRLKQYNGSEKEIRSISIICKDGTSVVYDFKTGSALNTLWSGTNDMRTSKPYLDSIDQIGLVVTPTMEMEENGEKSYIFHISKRMFDLKALDKGTIATAVISIDASALGNICKTDTENEVAFIINEDRQVIYYPEPMFMGITIGQNVEPVRVVELSRLLKNKTKLITEYENEALGWKYYYVYDKNYVLRDMKALQYKLFIIVGVLLLLSILLVAYFVKNIHHSISCVVQGMNQIKSGNLDVVIPVMSKDEVGQMADSFNEMAREVKELIEKVTIAVNKQKNAEINALEAQINPHFLYNTLDSINWMAIEKGDYEISNLLRDLGVILRYSINKSNHLVTIHEMVDWLSKYVSLQKVRFNDAFDYRITVDEGTRSKRIYKLLVQPFIENAIIHGFSGIEQGGLLSVNIGFTEDKHAICIIIEDNGNGMDKDVAEKYNDRERVLKQEDSGIGLSNALSRIDMYYGEKGSWSIHSIKDMGTVVTLIIPINTLV